MSRSRIKVLVLGKSGMLGSMVYRVLKEDPRLSVFATQMEDLGKPGYFNVLEGISGLKALMDKHSGFDYCVNCIGITANKIDEHDPVSVRRAYRINSVFPGQLARAAAAFSANIIHISTDGVFRGTRPWYDERSRPDCIDVYGETKAAGEIKAPNFLTIRCSILGPSPHEKGGLWEWFASRPQGGQVQGYANHVWNGVTTLQFARLCRQIIVTGVFTKLRKRSELYHFSPNRPVTKYRLLCILRSALGKRIKIIKVTGGTGKIKRIMRSRFTSLRPLIRHGVSMEKAVKETAAYERKRHG